MNNMETLEMKYSKEAGTATPGQKKLGSGLEVKLQVVGIDWETVSSFDARGRVALLLALKHIQESENRPVLRDWDGYLSWEFDHSTPSVPFDGLI